MGFVQRIFRRFGYAKVQPRRKQRSFRSYAMGKANRLTEGWTATNTSTNADLRNELANIRSRSRNLVENNDYAKKFIHLAKTNIVGPDGVILQNKARNRSGRMRDGENQIIESTWKTWGKRGSCEMTGRLDWVLTQQAIIEAVAKDGEVLIQYIRGPRANNPEGFAVHILEADYMPTSLWEERNNRTITLGVEHDGWMRPLAYHLYTAHPGSDTWSYRGYDIARIPATQMLHAYIAQRPNQLRGIPWFHTAGIRLNQLAAYEDAAVVAARAGASKFGHYVTDPESNPEFIGDGLDSDDVTPITEIEPGIIEKLPAGMRFEGWDPDYPHEQFDPFVKRTLMGIASGLNVSYMSLAGDLTGTSYSSGRIGSLDERDSWKILQNWFVSSVVEPIFSEWFKHAVLSGVLPFAPDRYEQMYAPTWTPKRWQWVDPQKEAKGFGEQIDRGLISRRRIALQLGYEWDEIVEELRQEEEELAGLELIKRPQSGGDLLL